MKKRVLSVPVVVLIAVVALVVGSLGTATAAGLTTKQVKKIAAKVVHQKASNLTVAKAELADKATLADSATFATNANSANNASNATNLGGVPASGYAKRIFARVAYTSSSPSIIAGSAGVTTSTETALGFPLVSFPQSMDDCAVVAIAASAAGTQIVRRSTSFTGLTIQFAIKDDAGAAQRANFDVIAVC